MRTILISFQPKWYEQIKSGEKIYEYRTQFPNEIVDAYMYVSKPVQAIIGYIQFGERIPLSKWEKEYKSNLEISNRIHDFMKRRNYAVPIMKFQDIEPLKLDTIKETFPNFVIPQSYYYLNNYPDLHSYISNKCKIKGITITNDFTHINKDKICSLRS